jgi:SAM-dependent methyltransferase
MTGEPTFDDWIRAPNIADDPATYRLENEAIARDGRLDAALHELAPWDGLTLLDIGCGTGFWLPRYAERAAHVIGVEPDPDLLPLHEHSENSCKAPARDSRRSRASCVRAGCCS